MQYVYLIKCNDFYKIGIAENVDKRLAQLSTGNPYKLTLIHAIQVEDAKGTERFLHNWLRNRRITGEWFQIGTWIEKYFVELVSPKDGKREQNVNIPTWNENELDDFMSWLTKTMAENQ